MKIERLLIIGNLYNDPIPKITLNKLLKIWNILFENITVISGDIYNVNNCTSNIRSNQSIIYIIYNSLKRQMKVLSLIKKSSFDICVIMLPFLIIPIIYIKIKNKKLILYIGGMASKSLKGEIYAGSINKIPMYILMKLIEKIAFTLADRLIIDSISSIKFFGLDNYRRKIVLYRNYIDINCFSKSVAISNRDKSIGFVGRLSKEKGILEFIYAANILAERDNNFNFIIVGNGTLYKYIKYYVDNNSYLKDRTQILGEINPVDMPSILNKLSLVILPSYSEGTPNSILEAMACGTPVLVTPVGGIPDIIKEGVTGFIINNNNPEAIANDVCNIFKNFNLEDISDNANKFIDEEYNYEKVMEIHKKMFQFIS